MMNILESPKNRKKSRFFSLLFLFTLKKRMNFRKMFISNITIRNSIIKGMSLGYKIHFVILTLRYGKYQTFVSKRNT